MIENINVLVTALSTITGAGGLGGILIWRHNRKMREMERRLRESEVEKAKVEAESSKWHLYDEQLETANNRIVFLLKENAAKEDRHQQDIKDWEGRFTEQTTYLRTVQRDLIAANNRELVLTQRLAAMTAERDHYRMWRCFREDDGMPEGCARRKPKQPIPIKYVPLIAGEAEPEAVKLPAPACE